MGDDLVYRIFIELAVLEGKRDLTGKWLTAESRELSRLLSKAFGIVSRAAVEGSARTRPEGKSKPIGVGSPKA